MEEGEVEFEADQTQEVSKDMDVFYNPECKVSRDLSLLFASSLQKDSRVALPLAGSGVRGLRLLSELETPFSLYVNDKRDGFKQDFLEAVRQNDLSRDSVEVFETEANKFLNNQYSFDYIEIDPFGSPNFFLDSSIRKLRHDGILGVKATDTAPLCGRYPTTCKRKYWSTPYRNYEYNERGIRILIRKVQLVGMQHEKALVPVMSYRKDHYFKVFFRLSHRKKACDELVEKHGTYRKGGPLWRGDLFDKGFMNDLDTAILDEESTAFFNTLLEEKDVLGFYDVHELASEHEKDAPKMDVLLDRVNGSRTHFRDTGFKTELDKEEVDKIFLEI